MHVAAVPAVFTSHLPCVLRTCALRHAVQGFYYIMTVFATNWGTYYLITLCVAW